MDQNIDDGVHDRLAFFVAATHNLKTPLSSLTLWMDTLEILKPRLVRGADAQTAALLDDVVDQMQTLVRRSVHMVDDVLDVVRLQAGRPLPFIPGEVDLVALTRSALHGRPEDSDVNMPRLSGFEVLREIRRVSDVPVIMLTARDEDMDQVRGLELGVDDYLHKPIRHPPLVARIRSTR